MFYCMFYFTCDRYFNFYTSQSIGCADGRHGIHLIQFAWYCQPLQFMHN